MHLVTEALTNALNQSQQILALAEEQQWDQVEEQLNHRDQLIKSALESEIKAEEAGEVRSLISEIQAIDQQLNTLAENRRNEISSDIKKQQKGKKMQAAYGKVKRPY